ncbi:hypothetical protein ACHQM5_005175 [Ranunculus cassubicifolius]
MVITKGTLWILIVFSVSSFMTALPTSDRNRRDYLERKTLVDMKRIAETIKPGVSGGGSSGGAVGGGGSSGGGGGVVSGGSGGGGGGGVTSTTGGGSTGRGSTGSSSSSGRGATSGSAVGASAGSSQSQSTKSSCVRTEDPMIGALTAMTACVVAAGLLILS